MSEFAAERDELAFRLGPHVPGKLDETALVDAVAARLGEAASGARPRSVVWVEDGDEVLVHLDSVQVRLLHEILLVSVDLESDETGRSPLVVAFALGARGDPAGLLAATDEIPRGHPLLAARWGNALQAAVWSSLTGLVQDHATGRGDAPRGLVAQGGQLQLEGGKPVVLSAPSRLA
jgi:hypothetical protein